MIESDFRPELVGREEELRLLEAHLDAAAQGRGSTVFISGEAGVGKTRLTSELMSVARSKGFQVLSGSSLHESLTPYMPFVEALESGGLDYLFAEQAPKVEAVYLVTRTGILIKDILRKETRLDPDLFASMLTTVGNFVKESLSMLSGKKKEGALNSLGYENYRILIESGEDVNLVVILTGRENELLVEDMKEIVQRIGRHYGEVLRDWDGDEGKFAGAEIILEGLVASGKYDGIFYGRNDPKARRSLLFENVRLGLTRKTKDNPILLCIDDLQWADPSSLALMHYVARGTSKCRLFILGLYRPEDIVTKEGTTHQLVETMQLMNREGLLEKNDLRRLPRQHIFAMLTSMLGAMQFGDEFVDRIYAETEGNPLFIVELVRMMVSEGIIKEHGGTWRLTQEPSHIQIPSRVFDVIARRLGKVTEDERRILDYASVIGDSFASSLLSEALEMRRVVLLERLRTLEGTHRLICPQEDRWRFDHSKIRDVLYSQIPPELRQEYHSIIARSIESLNGDNLDLVVGDLAFHYCRCKDKRQAPVYLIRAARKARNEYSNKEAIRFYGEALEFEGSTETRRDILENLGAIHEFVGQYDKSIECYESALGITEEKRKRAELKARIGNVYCGKGEHDKALEACGAAMDLLAEEESREKSLALRIMGSVCNLKGAYDKALEYYERSLTIGRKIGDDDDVEQVLMGIGSVYVRKGLYDKALEAYEQGLALGRKTDDTRCIARCLGNIGALHYHKGQYDEALKHYTESMEMFEKTGDIQGIAYSVNNLGVLHENRGQYDKALECYERCFAMVQRIGDKDVMAAAAHNVGVAHQYMGEPEKAIEKYRESLRISEEIGHQLGIAYNCCGIAEAYVRLGDWEKSTEFCKRAYHVSKETGLRQYLAAAERIFGMAYRGQKMWKESTESFEESIRILEEIHMERYLAESHREFGLMWAEAGDTENARKHLVKAIEIFRSVKADRDVAAAEKQLERATRGAEKAA